MCIRVAGLANARDETVAQANVGLIDSGVVNDQSIGDHRVDGSARPGDLALSHAIPDGFTSPEFHLLAIDGEILLNLDKQLGVGEANLVAGGGTIHGRIG